MSSFDEYAGSYEYVDLERDDGILLMKLHTGGGPLRWNLQVQVELAQAFADVGADRANRLVILTGTGDEFSGPRLDPEQPSSSTARSSRRRDCTPSTGTAGS
jgi:hypothetical protein